MEQQPQRGSVRVLVVGLVLVLCGVPALVWRATAMVGSDVIITTSPPQRATPLPVANAIASFGTFLITVGVVMVVLGALRRWRGRPRG